MLPAAVEAHPHLFEMLRRLALCGWVAGIIRMGEVLVR